MLDALTPVRLDNTYHGRKAALWLLGFVVAVRLAQSVVVLAGGASVVRSADGIPVDTFPAAAAQAVVALSALAALSRLLLACCGALALWRYRSAISLTFVLLLASHLGGQLILRVHPIPRVGAPPGPAVNVALLAALIGGLVLSLWRRPGEARASQAVRPDAA